MTALLLAALLSAPASAGMTGASDEQAAAATGFAGAYLRMIELSLESDPRYGTRLLDSLELHLRSISAMTSWRAVTDHLEITVLGAGLSPDELMSSLGKETMETQRAAALLLAHALSRPQQFREIVEGLEARRAGLGKNTLKLLRDVKKRGDKRLIAALRARGAEKPQGPLPVYARFGPLEDIFENVGRAQAPVEEKREQTSEPRPTELGPRD